MKNVKFKNIYTREIVSSYSVGKEIVLDRIEEMKDDGEPYVINFDAVPYEEILEIGFNYLIDNDSYNQL